MRRPLLYLFLLLPALASAQSSTTSTVYNIGIWLIIIGIAYFIFNSNRKKKREKEEYDRQIEAVYRAALQGTDKAHALDLGRRYYSNIRDGKSLTIYDEQALTNDLSTMRSA